MTSFQRIAQLKTVVSVCRAFRLAEQCRRIIGLRLHDLLLSGRRDMQLLVVQCRHHLKFFQRACIKHSSIYARLSPIRPFSQTAIANFPSNSVGEHAPTKNRTRTVTPSVSPPEEPVSSQKDTFGRPRSSEVTSTSPFPPRRIINPKSPATQFGIIAGVFLRHTARSLGYLVLPDGYIRVSDMVTYFSTNFEPAMLTGRTVKIWLFRKV